MLTPTRLTILLGLAPILAIAAGGGSAASVTLAWGLVVIIVLACLADGIFFDLSRRLTFQRKTPQQLYLGRPATMEWVVENRNDVPAWIELRDSAPDRTRLEPSLLRGKAPAQARFELTMQATPEMRGSLTFGDAFCRVRSRWGLAWRYRRLSATAPIRCYPYLSNWKAADLAAKEALVRQSGNRRYRWRGAGTVFESLRDYSSEDDIRWVDWKATARAQRPISRNFETERHQQVLILVDASRMMTTYCGTRTKFDTVLEAAVLAARAVTDQGDNVGLMVFSDRPDVYLHPRRERGQVTRIMEALYDRQPRLVEPDFETAISLTAQRNRRRSLIMLFTDVTVVESARRMAVYVRSLIPRHLPLVVTIADDAVEQLESLEPRDPVDFYRVGVAHELHRQRDELLGLLRTSGAVVLDSPADQVATRTIQSYLELKRRMRI